ncbi:MAG: cation transporter [Ignavibacteriae bacterium]|nr:cation transporter [Ignavibacteriota bacterium]
MAIITNNTKIKTAQISLYVGLLIFFIKISAFIITNSSAIFSDAAESIVHILATAMVLYSIILSSRPPDKTHLYGHGNIEYFSAGVEGLLIIVAALTIIYFAVSDLILGARPNQLDTGTILIGIAGITNTFLGYWIVRKGKQTNSLALVADGKHILTDAYTSIGVVFGLILVLITNIFIIDPLIAIFVALNIIFTGYKLIRESVGGLMMETDNDLLNQIGNLLNRIRTNYFIDVHQLRFWKSANKVFIDFHLTLPYFFNIKQSHEIEENILDKFQNTIPNSEIRIHLDFCVPKHCKYCNFDSCEVREEKFTELIEWNSGKLLELPIIKTSEKD